MKSLKSPGGLTRGRGMDETQRLTWLLSSPKCAEVNNVMQALTSLNLITSHQHKDMTKSRVERDSRDIKTLGAYLCIRSPFEHHSKLYNID